MKQPDFDISDLKADPGETIDIAARDPGETARLHGILGRWRVDVDANMPTANPDWNGGAAG